MKRLLLGLAAALFLWSSLPVFADVGYDRAAARNTACTDNYNDSSFKGDTEGRYSPTYVAVVLNAGLSDVHDIPMIEPQIPLDPENSIYGYHQIMDWLASHPRGTFWEAYNGKSTLQAGDFAVFSVFAGINADNFDPGGIHNGSFAHGAVFLANRCSDNAGGDYWATWNNERLDLFDDTVQITRAGDPAQDILSRVYIHILANDPPPAPAYITLANGLRNVGLSPQFTWTQGPDDEGETITSTFFFGLPGSSTPWANLTSGTLSYTIPQSATWGSANYLPGTLYEWHIDPTDGTSTTSGEVRTFRTSYQPTGSTPVSPTNGSTYVSVDTSLSWTAGNDQDVIDSIPGSSFSYQVRFGQHPDQTAGAPVPAFAALPVVASGLTTTTFQPADYAPQPRGGLIPNRIYCYHITVVDDTGLTNTTHPVTCFHTTYVEPPTNLDVTSQTQFAIGMKWDDNPVVNGTPRNENRYEVQWSQDESDWHEVSVEQLDHPVPADGETFIHLGVNCEQYHYFYRVRGYRISDDLYSDYSNTLDTTTRVCYSPGKPVLIEPLDGLQILNPDPLPIFRWTGVYLATSYKIVFRTLNKNVAYTTDVLHESTTCPDNLCKWDPPDDTVLKPDTIYTWEVQAFGENPVTTSEAWKIIRTAYYTATPQSPVGTITDTRGNLEYVWLPAPDAPPEYEVAIYNKAGTTRLKSFSVTAAVACASSPCRYQPSKADRTFLMRNGDYQWGIFSQGPAGKSAESNRLSFTLNAPVPGVPTPVSPNGVNVSDDSPTFQFIPDAYGSEYEVSIYRGTTRVTGKTYPFDNYCLVPSMCEVPSPAPLANGDYTWSVRTSNSAKGTMSAYAKPALPFHVGGFAPLAFTLIAPAPDVIIYQPSPRFTWNLSTDALSYTVTLRRNNAPWKTFTVQATSCTPTECALDLSNVNGAAVLLLDNSSYTWQVTAVNLVGTMPSQIRAFTSDLLPDTIAVIAPLASPPVTIPTPLIRWQADPQDRLAVYRVQVLRPNKSTFMDELFTADTICTGGECSVPLSALLQVNGAYTLIISSTITGIGTVKNTPNFTFPVDVMPPLTLQSPKSITVPTPTPSFVWTHDPRWVAYRLEVRQGSTVVMNENNFDLATICPTTTCQVNLADYGIIPNNGAVSWTLTGTTSTHLTLPVTANFTVNVVLPAITLTSPIGNVPLGNPEAEFKWQYNAKYTHYRITITGPNSTSIFAPYHEASSAILCPGGVCTFGLASVPETLPVTGSYSWKITGLIQGFTPMANSPVGAFRLDGNLPQAIPLLAPGATFTSRTPTFQWTHDGRVEEYRLIIYNAAKVEIINSDWVTASTRCTTTTCSLPLTTMLNAQDTYHWKVEGRRAGFDGRAESVLRASKLINIVPTLLQIVRPTNGARVTPPTDNPQLQWTHSASLTEYQVKVTDPTGITLADTGWMSSAAFNCTTRCEYYPGSAGHPLNMEGTFKWQVWGRIPGFTPEPASALTSFVLSGFATPIIPTAPGAGAPIKIPQPTFTWQPNALYNDYELRLYDTAAATGVPIFVSGYLSSATLCTPSCAYSFVTYGQILPREGTIYWQVWGRKTNFLTQGKSTPRAIAVSNLIPVTPPNLLSPVATKVYHPNQAFEWSSSGFDLYHVIVKRGTTIVHDQIYPNSVCAGATCSIPNTSFLFATSGAYSWTVGGRMNDISTERTKVASAFTVELLPPNNTIKLNLPISGGQITNINTPFSWFPDTPNDRVDNYYVTIKFGTEVLVKDWHVDADLCEKTFPTTPPMTVCVTAIPNENISYRKDGLYTWQVRATRDESGESTYSAIGSYKTSFKPPAAKLTYPIKGATTPAINSLLWDGDKDRRVAEYKVVVTKMDGTIITNENLNTWRAFDYTSLTGARFEGLCTNTTGANIIAKCELPIASLMMTEPWGNGSYKWYVISYNSLVGDTTGVVSPTETFYLSGMVGAAPMALPPMAEGVRQDAEAVAPVVYQEPVTATPTSTFTMQPSATPIAPSETVGAPFEATLMPTPTEGLLSGIPTVEQPIVIIPTETPVPTATPLPTEVIVPTLVPTETPFPTAIPLPVAQAIRISSDGVTVHAQILLCVDAVCEPVTTVTDALSGQVVAPVEMVNGQAVYALAGGYQANLWLQSASFTIQGVDMGQP